MTKKEIKVKNLSVAIKTGKENDDFICLTDMAKFKGEETGIVIAKIKVTWYPSFLVKYKKSKESKELTPPTFCKNTRKTYGL